MLKNPEYTENYLIVLLGNFNIINTKKSIPIYIWYYHSMQIPLYLVVTHKGTINHTATTVDNFGQTCG